MSRLRMSPVVGVVLLALLVGPVVLPEFLVSIGVFGFAAGIGAIGLCLLLGHAGQLSLGHAFFLAVGAYTYLVLVSDSAPGLPWGLGVPPVVGIAGAMAVASVFGAAFCLIAKRLGGISIGLASISLVLIGQHVLNAVPGLSGGASGRPVPPLRLGNLEVTSGNQLFVISGFQFNSVQRSWYLFAIVLLLVAWFAYNLVASRSGRAFQAVRDGSIQASTSGIDPLRVRVVAFAVSSALAGLSGALLALAFQYVVPEYWGLGLSLSMLAMLVIGGQTSIAGAVVGAMLVTGLPIVFRELNLAQGSGWLSLNSLPDILYGLGIVLIIYYQPDGLAGLARRLAGLLGRAGGRPRRAAALADS